MAEIDRLNFVMGMDTAPMARGGTAVTRVFGRMNTKFKAVIGTVGLLSAVFVGFAVKAVKAGTKFESAWNEVRTLLDETTTDTVALRKEVLRLADSIGRPPTELSQGLYQVISAGVSDTADAMHVLEVATKASIAGLTDSFTAVDAITTVMNAWKLEIKDVTLISDLMFNAVKEGKLTFGELSANIGKVATTAALAKVSFAEVSAALATMTKSGLSMEESTTALNQLLLQTIKSQDEAKITAKKYGFELSATALAAKGLGGLMNDIATATDGNIDALVALMPNIRAFTGEAILAGMASEEFNRILKTTETVLGSTEEALGKIKEGLEETSKALSAKLEVIYIRFAEKIIPALNKGLQATIDLLKSITESEADKILKAIRDIEGISSLTAQVLLRERINDLLEDQEALEIDNAFILEKGGNALSVRLGTMERLKASADGRLAIMQTVANQLVDIARKEGGLIILEEKRVQFAKELQVAEIAVASAFVDQETVGKRGLKILENNRDAIKTSIRLLDRLLDPLTEQKDIIELIGRLEREIDRLRKEGVKDTKKIAENVKDTASEDLELEFSVAFENIGRAGDAIGRLSNEIGALSMKSTNAIIQMGRVADNIGLIQSASRDASSRLIDKLVPGLSIVASGFSILNSIFGDTETQIDTTGRAAERLAEQLRKLEEAFERSIRLRDISAAKEIQERLDRLFATGDLAGISESLLAAFAGGATLQELFPQGAMGAPALGNIISILRSIGQEGAQAFIDFQNVVRDALEDGIITDAEARAIDKAIAKMAEFPGLMSSFSDETLEALDAIEALTDQLSDLADEAERTAEEVALERQREFIAGLPTARLLPAMDEAGELPENRAVRQFVGITELQGNFLIGVLSTSRAIQQSILDLLAERLGAGGGLSIESINRNLGEDIENAERGIGVLS